MTFSFTRPSPGSGRRRLFARASTTTVAVAAASLLLVGCASGSTSTAAGSSSSAVTCATKQDVNLMMGTSNLDVSYAPYGILAKELGYMDDECLNVTISTTGTSVTTAQALTGGTADIAMQSPDNLIISQGKDPLPISMFYNLIPKSIYTLAVMPTSGISSFADLKGKKIGVTTNSALYDAYLTARLKEVGLSLSDITEVATGYGNTPMEALKSGSIDAFLAWPGLWASYENAGYTFNLLPEASWQDDYYGIGLGATNAYITAHPDIIEKVSRAVARSSVYLQKNPDEAVKLFWKDYPELAPLPGTDETAELAKDRKVLDSTITEMKINDRTAGFMFGVQDDATWAKQIQYDTTAGLLTKPVEPSVLYTNAYNTKANDFDWSSITG